jgi:hypothetical protein
MFNMPCVYWPARASTPVSVNGRGVSSALLVDETLDAATPYSGSLAVRRLFPNASLIAEPGGTTHADTLSHDECVDDAIASYLQDGTRPARQPGNTADATCAPLPDPMPTSAAGSTNAGTTSQQKTGTVNQAPTEPNTIPHLRPSILLHLLHS